MGLDSIRHLRMAAIELFIYQPTAKTIMGNINELTTSSPIRLFASNVLVPLANCCRLRIKLHLTQTDRHQESNFVHFRLKM